VGKRKKTRDAVQAEVLVLSRRRCCICFGLKRDDTVKKGQIAHLDGDPGNNDRSNLAFLCFDHHDEYDGRTSQSKGFTVDEVKAYRSELYAQFETWTTDTPSECLLNFLASTIDLDTMADAAIKIAGTLVCYAEEHAYDVLVTHKIDYCDGSLYTPHLIALDHYASWGWLTFEEEEREEEPRLPRVYITVEHKPICRKVAELVKKRFTEKGGDTARLRHIDARSKDALAGDAEIPQAT